MSSIPGPAIADQLEKILASPQFSLSVRMCRFLRYTVELARNGHGAIKEYRVGVDVFDRQPDYDPRVDPIVRVEARRLRVVAWNSAAQFRGDQPGIPAIAKRLQVSSVLTGSVRMSGARLRVRAQLIDAASGSGAYLWSETHDREVRDVFAIQEEPAVRREAAAEQQMSWTLRGAYVAADANRGSEQRTG